MNTEIEHKYLVTDSSYLQGYSRKTYFRQGYLTTHPACVVRVRIANDKAYLTIKGLNKGATRAEYEWEIETDKAQSMLNNLCTTPIIEKTRYIYPYKGHTWEIDCFAGDNNGLVIAEIELDNENEPYECPPFIGKNVTGVERYYNSSLAQHPYSLWSAEEKQQK